MIMVLLNDSSFTQQGSYMNEGVHISSGVAKVGNGWAQVQPIMSGAQPIATHVYYLFPYIHTCFSDKMIHYNALYSYYIHMFTLVSFLCVQLFNKHELFLQSIIRTPYSLLKCAQPMLWI